MLRSGAKRSRCDLPKFRGTARNQARSTVANARNELGAEARKPKPAKPLTEPRQRAQRFLRDALAHGPKRVTDVEEAAEKAHIDAHALTRRAPTSASSHNAGGVMAVQWSWPG